MTTIINNIGTFFHWDIFLMGAFTLLMLVLGISILIYPLSVFSCFIRRYITYITKLNFKEGSIFVLLVAITIYFSGIMVNTLSDIWIDNSNYTHLQIAKRSWLEDKEVEDTDEKIKKFSFVNVYNTKEYDEDEINDFYYHAKHTLINEEHNATWGDYILYSQVIINISRVWALVFYILVILMFLRFLITLYRPCIHQYRHQQSVSKHNLDPPV